MGPHPIELSPYFVPLSMTHSDAMHFLENYKITNLIQLKCAGTGPVDNNTALVQVMFLQVIR